MTKCRNYAFQLFKQVNVTFGKKQKWGCNLGSLRRVWVVFTQQDWRPFRRLGPAPSALTAAGPWPLCEPFFVPSLKTCQATEGLFSRNTERLQASDT